MSAAEAALAFWKPVPAQTLVPCGSAARTAASHSGLVM